MSDVYLLDEANREIGACLGAMLLWVKTPEGLEGAAPFPPEAAARFKERSRRPNLGTVVRQEADAILAAWAAAAVLNGSGYSA